MLNTFWKNAAFERILPELVRLRNAEILEEMVRREKIRNSDSYERSAAEYYRKHGTQGEF